LYESLNLAALWSLPILIIVEDNHYAQTTPVEKAVAGKMKARFTAFGIPVWECDTTDVLEIRKISRKAVQSVRIEGSPGCLLLHTYRFAAHSKGDDTRTPEELERIRQYDPLLVAGGRLTNDEIAQVKNEIAVIIEQAFERASQDPFPSLIKDHP
jgi:TPP-dependent pyruvate/acetoin dehydrogenase alpha subunit